MTTHFHGCNNLVTITTFIFFLVGSPAVAGRDNPLVEIMSSGEELVQMAGYGEEKLSSVLVSGALVAVSCHTIEKTSKSNWVRGTTDEFGDFLMDLPSHLHAIPNLDKRCLVKVLRLPNNPLCHPGFSRKQLTRLKLSSVGNGIRTYTTRSLHLTPKPPQGCTHTVIEKDKGAPLKTYGNRKIGKWPQLIWMVLQSLHLSG
ncbi:pollen Ole e 1 allergen and extensin family protein [Actinidia rufa]|uniref:Pollen Ole e 1 allergen and extensin family protein n=1 Tax=Actinidia rufa TaxID=165716 RepID=A0A7J0FXE4_9ERIC|nr:pollen Ole e 1 allergen and extensin family protein [Actinidia rufa]